MEPSRPEVVADQLRIIVEVGDEYEPTERVARAWAELTQALAEADAEAQGATADDVSGFEFPKLTLAPLIYTSVGRGETRELWNGKDKFPQQFDTNR